MVINSFKKRNNLTWTEGVDKTENFDTKSLKHHVITSIILKQNVQILRFFENLKYFFVIKRFILSKPFNCYNFQINVFIYQI